MIRPLPNSHLVVKRGGVLCFYFVSFLYKINISAKGNFFLTSSLKKYVFHNWLINNILYLCAT